MLSLRGRGQFEQFVNIGLPIRHGDHPGPGQCDGYLGGGVKALDPTVAFLFFQRLGVAPLGVAILLGISGSDLFVNDAQRDPCRGNYQGAMSQEAFGDFCVVGDWPQPFGGGGWCS